MFFAWHFFQRATNRIKTSSGGNLARPKLGEAQLWLRLGRIGHILVLPLRTHGKGECTLEGTAAHRGSPPWKAPKTHRL